MSNSLAFATPQFWRERVWAAGILAKPWSGPGLLAVRPFKDEAEKLEANKLLWTVLLHRSSAQVLGYIALDPY